MRQQGIKWWRLAIPLCMLVISPLSFSAISKSPLTGATSKSETPPAPAPVKKDKRRPKAEVPTPSRTVLMYENHCTSCHESAVHIQNKRKAKNLGQIKNWVTSRAEWLKLNWTEKDINEVTEYLNKRYYKYKK
jgi:cytochrome c5